MANVTIKLTQDVIDQEHKVYLKHGDSDLVTGVVDLFAKVNYLINSQYYYYSTYSFDGQTFRANYPDGSFNALTGTYSNTQATSGTAEITNTTFFKPNDISFSSSGNSKYLWFSDFYGPLYLATSGTLDKINLTTWIPSSSAEYDPFYGNARINLDGKLSFNQSRDLSGFITDVSISADKLLKSSLLKGDIQISGNIERIGQGLEKSKASGSISQIEYNYFDGSLIKFDFLNSALVFDDISKITPILEQGKFFPSADVIDIDLPSKLYKPFVIQSGDGNDTIKMRGGGGLLSLNSGLGNDKIYLFDGDHLVDGGGGFDTVIFAHSKDAVRSFSYSSDGQGVVLDSESGRKTLLDIELIQFTDSSYSPFELRQFYTPLEEFSVVRGGQALKVNPTFFTGLESLNLHYQFIDVTLDSVVIGSGLNDFIAMQGGGVKAVNGGGGNDVIDGGVGSTFISGGGGSNVFFLDGRASGVSWSTITDFSIGTDKATIWGWKQGVSQVARVDEFGGALGYQGVTLHFENLLPSGASDGDRNGTWNSITFTGKTLSDFGASSLEMLNAQIAAGTNSFFSTGQTVDEFGTHGYLYVA